MDQAWNRFKAGDEAAFNEIYNRFSKLLYTYGIKLVKDETIVRECIQDLFIWLYEQRMSIKPPQNWTSYLIVTLRNRLYKALQSPRFVRIESAELDRKIIFDLSIDMYETMENSDLKEDQLNALQMALDELTPQQREIIYLKYYKNLSVEEVAAIIGINHQMVYNATYKAIQRLRKSETLARAFSFLWG